MPELTAPFVMKNDEKRIVSGPVLIPDEPDTDGDVVTSNQIENVAHQFVEEYGNIDLQHSLNNVGKMIESYILPMDLQIDDNLTVPKGSWMLGVRVTDDDSWEAVKDGRLGGFSIMGIQKMAMKSTEKKQSEKRTTLADLGDNWIVNAVSLVDQPAVPKAKFIAIKSKGKKVEEEITDEAIQKAIDGSLEHRERLVTRHVYATFDSETTDSMVHSTFDDSVIIRVEDMIRNQSHMLQIPYEIDDSGNVIFTGDPQEVRIEENVVPKSTGGDPTSNPTKEGGMMQKILKSLGFGQAEKQGRSISEENYQKLRAAKEVIEEILAVGESERSGKTAEKGEFDMKEEEIQELIEKKMQPINDKLTDLTESIKSLNTDPQEAHEEEETEEGTETSEKSKKPNDKKTEKNKDEEYHQEEEEEDTVSKSAYDDVLEQLEKAKKSQPFSRRLAGQDSVAEKQDKENTKSDRNPFGYKNK